MEYIYFSPFLGNQKSHHGGVKRSLQIKELLEKYNCISINPYISIKSSIKKCICSPNISLKLLSFAIYLYFFKGVSIKGSFLFVVRTISIMKIINQYKSRDYIFEGGTTISILTIYYLSKLKLNCHIFPQNIEFIAPKSKPDNYFKSNCFKYSLEIEAYKLAKSVTTVSKFDRAILECHKINSYLLTSFPDKSSFKNLSSIALKRKNYHLNKRLKSKKVLLIGTTYNHPTKEGLQKILEYLCTKKFKFKVDLVGFGTSQFKNFLSKNINVIGPVSDIKLQELMIKSDCLIINTIQTSGYLFKVVEFNLSGIPIIFTNNFLQHENLEEYGIFNCELAKIESLVRKIDPLKNFKKFKKKNIDWL